MQKKKKRKKKGNKTNAYWQALETHILCKSNIRLHVCGQFVLDGFNQFICFCYKIKYMYFVTEQQKKNV